MRLVRLVISLLISMVAVPLGAASFIVPSDGDLARQADLIIEGVDLETTYNKDLFPNGILGLNAEYVNQYVQYVADRRLEELGLPKHYGATNPAKWMGTATDVYELVNFFETQNTSYEVDVRAHTAAPKPPTPEQDVIQFKA